MSKFDQIVDLLAPVGPKMELWAEETLGRTVFTAPWGGKWPSSNMKKTLLGKLMHVLDLFGYNKVIGSKKSRSPGPPWKIQAITDLHKIGLKIP